MPFLSSLDNLLSDACIIFEKKSVDSTKHGKFWLGLQYPLRRYCTLNQKLALHNTLPNQTLAFFVLYLKIINTFEKINECYIKLSN